MMEVVRLEDRNGMKNGMLTPGSCASPMEPRYRDIVAETDDKVAAEECDHFSIRLYVSQSQKRDPKFQSLSQMFHYQQHNAHCNSLSSFSVPKFRQWDCKSCLDKVKDKVKFSDNKTAARTVSAKLDDKNNYCSITFIRSTPMANNAGCKKFSPCTQELPRDDNVEKLTYLESTTKESNHKCYSPNSCDKNGTTEAHSGPAIKDFQVSLNNYDGALNVSSNASADTIVVSKTCHMTPEEEQYGTENLGGLKPPEVIHKTNADKNQKSQEFFIVDGNTSKLSRPISERRGDQVVNRFPHGEVMSKRSTEFNCNVENKRSTSQFGTSDVKFRQKKPKKVRLLSEIINSDGVGTSRIDLECDHEKDADLDDNSLMPLPLERKDGTHVSHHTTGLAKRKKKYKGLDVVDDGSSLMNWLKRSQKKLRTVKEDSSHKDNAILAANTKSGADESASKDMDFNSEQIETVKCKENSDTSCMRHDTRSARFLSPNGSLGKRKMPTTANVQHGDGNTENNDLRRNIRKSDKNTQNNDLKRNMHKTSDLCQIQSENSKQRYISKVSPGKHYLQNVTNLHEQRTAKKKQHTQELTQEKGTFEFSQEKETLDGIPMDIVELLAKSQRDRQLMSDADAFETHCAKTKTTGDGRDDGILIAAERTPNEVSTGLHTDIQKKCLTLEKKQKSLQCNAETSIQTTSVCPPKFQKPDYLHLERGQHTQLHNAAAASTSSRTLLDNRDHHIARKPTQSWSQKETNKLMWDSFKTATRDSSLQPGSSQFIPTIQCVDSTFSHVRSTCSNYRIQQPEMATFDPQMNSGTNQVQIRSFPTTLSTMEAGNMSRISGLSGLYTKEPMPAMHLLRLMDSSKHAGFQQYETPIRNQTEFLQPHNLYSLHNQYNGSTSTSYQAESNLNEQIPLAVEGFARYQHHQNIHKPLRPLPRVGVLGSLLQKEITSWSENCGTQSGYKIGLSEGLTPFQTNRKESFEPQNSGMYSLNWNARQLGCVSSVVNQEFLSAQGAVAQSWTKGKGNMADPLDKFVTQDICVTNRNPADFTTISDDNEYMISL